MKSTKAPKIDLEDDLDDKGISIKGFLEFYKKYANVLYKTEKDKIG